MLRRIKQANYVLLILCVLGSFQVSADSRYGRLFSTPEQRQTLDTLRKTFDPAKLNRRNVTDYKKANGQSKKPRANAISLKGIVTRSHGEPSVWIDKSVLDNGQQKQQGIELVKLPDGSTAVKLKDGTFIKPVHIKPGQTLIKETGEVLETYKVKRNDKPSTTQ